MRVPAALFSIFIVLPWFSTTTRGQSAAPPISPTVAQSSQPSQAQTPEQIVASLEKHTVVLRNFYTDASLTFDAQGKLISAGTPGFGPTDGRIYVEKAEIKPHSVAISGVRPVLVWRAQTSDFQMTNTGVAVKLNIQLDQASATPESLATLLNQVLVKNSELQKIQMCPDSDKVRRLSGPPLWKNTDWKNLPDAQDLSELRMLCFPGGEKAYTVAQGLKAPRAVYTPDPQYSREAQANKYQGTVVLALIIDASGKPTTIVVTRPLGMGLDERALAAVKSWKFAPATFQGKPVPVAINVEINFRLH